MFLVLNRMKLSYKVQGMILVAVCAAILVWRIVLVKGMGSVPDRTYLATDTRVDSILIGCATAIVANPVFDAVRHSRQLARLALLGAAVLAVTLAVDSNDFRETFGYSLQSVAIAAILVYVVAVPTSAAGKVLNLRPFVWLGQLSYAFYLVHFVVLLEAGKHLPTVPATVVALPIGLGLAMLLQRFVERPARRLRDRIMQPHAAQSRIAVVAE
jgi:peptidoglycan/LPS O-acetylase OafA/YrhL